MLWMVVFANMWVEFGMNRLVRARPSFSLVLEVNTVVGLLVPVKTATNGSDSPTTDAGSAVLEFLRLWGWRPVRVAEEELVRF